MKKPKFTGIKKNHSAMWIGVPTSKSEFKDLHLNRVRILTSNGKWGWTTPYRAYEELYYHMPWISSPCWTWDIEHKKIANQIKSMNSYDKFNKRETIFLGYVKDVE